MEPLHPNPTEYHLESALLAVIGMLLLGVLAQWLFGHWDKFLEVATRLFPIWHWGG